MATLLLWFQDNPNGGANVDLWILNKDFSVVIFLNDSFGEWKSKAPSPAFGRKSGGEDCFVISSFNAFSGISYVNQTFFFGFGDIDVNFTASIHGVDWIFT